MALLPGTRLGPYEIVVPLGAGGMGEVYRARDTRLGREVAVKVLPQHLSDQPEVRARFEREARTVSGLNHPNICTLFDVGRDGNVDYLVMELVDGETLASRIARGALTSAELLRIGSQIADALDRAHRAGVIHRDLKPGNVMLTKSGAKLMDFGLARATGLAPAGGSGLTAAAFSRSPTRAAPLTAEGTIVGTFQYMSPEQLEGKEADARSDIWAFGCVLYEMATGARAFVGESQASLIGAIMRDEPRSLVELAPFSPPALDRVVAQCLAKDPDDRWQSAGDLKRALEWSAGPPVSAASAAAPAIRRPRWRHAVPAALWLAAGAALASGAWLVIAAGQPRAGAAVLDLPTAPGAQLSGEPSDVVISPDGRSLAYVGVDSTGLAHLWVRPLDSADARMLPQTARAQHPFWSPDSRWIAFFTTGEGAGLFKIEAAGGAPIKLCDVQWSRGGAWGPHGDILFSPSPTSPISRIGAAGGAVTQVTVLDSTRHETSHRHPSFVGDGEHFVYVALPATAQGWTLYLASLHSRAIKKLGSALSAATWVEPGYLLYDREGRFVAQRYDPGRQELVGDVIPLADTAPRTSEDATRIASASRSGRIAMLRGASPMRGLQWFDRSGAPGARMRIPDDVYYWPVLSHDGRYALLTRSMGRFAAQVMRVELARGVLTGLTDPHDYDAGGCWSPDDRTLAASTVHGGGHEEVTLLSADGSGAPRLLPTSSAQFKSPVSWSPDGRTLVVDQISAGTGNDLVVVDAIRGGTPRPLAVDPGAQNSATISPDGHWVAYDSDETGTRQVFVRRFPEGTEKLQITTAGGGEPHWSRGGKELISIDNESRNLSAVPFEPGREPDPTAFHLLMRLPFRCDPNGWDVTADGSRFLVSAPDAALSQTSTMIIVDWPSLLQK